MASKYCCNCNRMVGVEKSYTGSIIMIVLGILIFLMIPLVGLLIGPAMVIIGILMMIFSGSHCAICKGRNLKDSEPTQKDSETNQVSIDKDN